jgi:branched-chain amino acid transport system substrate-binding protein
MRGRFDYGRRWLVAAVLVPAVLAAGCSSSKGKTSDTTSTGASAGQSSPAPTLTGSPISLGVLADVTGPFAGTLEYSAYAAQAWAQWVNANGGVNGHPVVMHVGDTKSDPSVAQQVVKQLVEQDHVVALVGDADSTESAWSTYIEQKKIPVIGGSAVSPLWGSSPMFFQTGAYTAQYHPLDAVAMKSAGAKSLALVVCAEVAACAQAQTIVKPVADAIGVRYDGTLKIAATAPSYTAQCLKLKEQGTQSLFALLGAATLQTVIQNCAQQQYNPIIGVAGTTPNDGLIKISGLNGVAVMEGFPWWTSDPGVVQFRDALTTYEPGKDYQSPAATATWGALQLFRTALAEDASLAPTSANILTAMYNLKPTNLDGLLPVTVSYQAAAPTAKVSQWCEYVVRIEGGKFVAPDGLKPTCPAS